MGGYAPFRVTTHPSSGVPILAHHDITETLSPLLSYGFLTVLVDGGDWIITEDEIRDTLRYCLFNIRPERNYRLAIPHPVLYGSYERENFVKIIVESEKVDSTIKEEMKEGHWWSTP